MLNKVYDLSVNFLWESLFGDSEFCLKYWDSRKFFNFTKESLKWMRSNSHLMKRKLVYSVELGVTFGRANNVEEQVNNRLIL